MVTTKMKRIDGWGRTTCGISKLYQSCRWYADFVGCCVSGLVNHRLNLDFYRLLTSTIMFSWSGLSPDSLVWQDPAGAAAKSLDDFASQAATWAKQCLAFRSSKTWSPTRQSSCFLTGLIWRLNGSYPKNGKGPRQADQVGQEIDSFNFNVTFLHSFLRARTWVNALESTPVGLIVTKFPW